MKQPKHKRKIDSESPHVVRESPASMPNDSQAEFSDSEFSKAREVGLCASCGLRDSCARPKQAGGTWSCNDYR